MFSFLSLHLGQGTALRLKQSLGAGANQTRWESNSATNHVNVSHELPHETFSSCLEKAGPSLLLTRPLCAPGITCEDWSTIIEQQPWAKPLPPSTHVSHLEPSAGYQQGRI